MQELLFNPALWMPAVGVAVAVAVFVYGNNRTNRAVRNAGLGALAAVVAWCAAAYAVQTPVERCVTRSHAIVDAAERGDWPAFNGLLDRNTNLEVLRGNAAITTAAQAAAERYGLKDIRVLSTTALPGVGSYDVTLTTLLEGARPIAATFRFEYEQRSDGLLLARIVPVKIGEQTGEQLRRVNR